MYIGKLIRSERKDSFKYGKKASKYPIGSKENKIFRKLSKDEAGHAMMLARL